MSTSELTQLTLVQAAHAIRHGKITSYELTQALLERIARLDGDLHSFITVMTEDALQQARQADQQMNASAASGGLPPLYGVPVALKDLFDTAGVRTTAGATFFAHNVPAADAYVVQKLRQAGAIILGKTNLHEVALGLTSANPHYGICRNPWGRAYVAGGSSGGSAAALAACFTPGALGTDTGGSIRVPAAFCGVVGLKPTRGRVSTRGVIPLSWNLDHVGPMARRVEDCALLLQVIAGYDPQDPYSVDLDVDDYLAELGAGVRGWRLAVLDDPYLEPVQAEVRQAVQDAAQLLAGLGATVETVELPELPAAAQANGLMTIADAAAFHRQRLLEQPLDFGQDVRQRLQNGRSAALDEYIQARRTQDVLRSRFSSFFTQYDALLLPTTAIPAPPVSSSDAVELARLLTRYTAPFNLTGLPAISLPCGLAPGAALEEHPAGTVPSQLPIGLEIVGPLWSEARLLRLAHTFQEAAPWSERQALV